MKVNKKYKPKSFKLRDNYNIDYSPYYTIENGIYKFNDKLARINFMFKYGIMCQAKRKIIDGKLTICYYDKPITNQQRDFLRKRASALIENLPEGDPTTYYECECKKKKA